MGGMALHFGWIAEMKTGEGKTLVSTLPVYLNALAGKGVHVVTVNDYLAARDAEWMGQLYQLPRALTVGRVEPDIDRLAGKARGLRCGHHLRHQHRVRLRLPARQHGPVRGRTWSSAATTTPSSTRSTRSSSTRPARRSSSPARPTRRRSSTTSSPASPRTLRARRRLRGRRGEAALVVPTEEGIDKVERQLGVENLYDAVAVNYVHQLTKALQAKELYHRDKDYIVADGEVKIVDEFTGRVLEGRRWSDGLHQAVEAKERVKIKEENHTWATVTLQNYFRMYEKLAGMTGTAETEAAEFAYTYKLEVVPIPTNLPMVRDDHADYIFKTEDGEVPRRRGRHRRALRAPASRCSSARPRSRSPSTSRGCSTSGASRTRSSTPSSTAREAEIVAQAGRLARRHRGDEHGRPRRRHHARRQPRGTAPGRRRSPRASTRRAEEGHVRYTVLLEKFRASCAEEAEQVRSLGGLYVLGSERHESRRIDNQLRGRSGRQGDPGESRFYLSLEDELMRIFARGQ